LLEQTDEVIDVVASFESVNHLVDIDCVFTRVELLCKILLKLRVLE
jgi:hypothetical protein